MKRNRLKDFVAGIIATIICLSVITTALAATGRIVYNGMNVTVNGDLVLQKQDTIEMPYGAKIPSTILYVDEYGGGTTYLPVRWLAENVGLSLSYNGETGTVEIGKTYIATEPDDFLQEIADAWLVDGDYPKNSAGETYGPESISSIVGYRPDLIAATATNGEDGFIRRTELDNYLSTETPQHNSIPVYDLNGNVIGDFVFENG